ncbi:MAG: hypothetical protein WBF93_00165, partial [Pirellulales bacterium]
MTLRRSRWATVFLFSLFLFALIAGLFPTDGLAADAAAPEASARFRRIYVPADRVEEWPKGAHQIVPIDANRFDELVRRAERPQAASAAVVDSIYYTAEIEEEDLLTGQATLDVSHRGDQALVSLGACRAAIQRAVWRRDGQAIPARLGTDGQDRLLLVVDQAGRLELQWSLRGVRDANGSVRFPLELPTVPGHRFELSLPQDVGARATGAVVTRMERRQDGSTWTMQWPPSTRPELVITARQPGEPMGSISLRQTDTYIASLQGLDLTTILDVDVDRGPLEELILRVDDDLDLVDVRLGAQQIGWSEIDPSATSGRQISLAFPKPIVGRRTIVIRAVTALKPDQAWRLPRVHPVDAVQLKGSATLVVSQPLFLAEVRIEQGAQSNVEALPDVRAGEALQFQYYALDASIEVVVRNHPASLHVESATMIELDEHKCNARVVVDAAAKDGEIYSITGKIGEGWQILSLASTPEGLVHWQVDDGTLSMWLERGVSDESPMRFVLSAVKGQSPLGQRLQPEDLRVLVLHNVARRRDVYHLATGRPLRLNTSGDDAPKMTDASVLTPQDLSRLGDYNATGLWWVDGPLNELAAIDVDRRSPEYFVDNHVAIQVKEDSIAYTFRIDCRPQSRGVDRLIVAISDPEAGPKQWSISGLESIHVDGRPLTPEQKKRFGLPPSAAAWELSWSRSLHEPFQVVGEAVVEGQSRHEVRLLSVPTAAEQTGDVTIRGTERVMPRLRNTTLQPQAVPEQSWAMFASVRGYYRFDPALDVAADATLTIEAPEEDGGNASAVVWRRTIASRIDRDARANHRAQFEIENYGLRQMKLFVPEGVEVQQTSVDGQTVTAAPARDDQQLSVRFPANRRFLTVTVDYSTTRPASRFLWINRIVYPQLITDIPVLMSGQEIYAPDGFGVVDALDRSPFSVPLTWRRRLFGSLARADGKDVFDPFRRSAWKNLFQFEGNGSAETPQVVQSDPWYGNTSGSDGTADRIGWSRAAHLDSSAVRGHVYLVDRHQLRALMWAVGMLTAVGLWSCWPRRLPIRMGIIVAPAVAALLLPGLIAPLATAALGGVMLALIGKPAVIALRKFVSTGPEVVADESLSSPTLVATGSTFKGVSGFARLIAILVPALSVLSSFIAGAAEQSIRTATPIQPVFVPINEDREVTGDTYYLPQSLLKTLQESAGSREGRAEWIVSKPIYNARLEWDAKGNQLVLVQLTANYDLDVYHSRAEVRLPLGRIQPASGSMDVTLDGRPVDARRIENGGLVSFVAPRTGAYRLAIDLVPPAVVGDFKQVDLSIPALATSRLVMTLPDNVDNVEIPSAIGPVVRDKVHDRLVAELGSTDRLILKWHHKGAIADAEALDVDQLVVLELQPGAIVVEAKLKLNPNEGKIRQLRLAVDPALSLLPDESILAGEGGVKIVDVTTIPGDPQEIILQFDKPLSGRQAIRLSFFVRDAVGVGNVRLPYLEVRGARTSRHWLLVYADASLRVDVNNVLPHPALTAVERASLVEQWELRDVRPVLSYRQTQAKVDWSFPSKSQAPATSGAERLSVTYSQDAVNVWLNALLTTDGGYLFQHRIVIPEDLNVTRVSVETDRRELVRRWVKRNGTLTVFLDRPLTGTHQVNVAGTIPRKGDVEQLPWLRTKELSAVESSVLIHRHDDVTVEVIESKNMEVVKDPGSESSASRKDRLVGELRQTGDDAAAKILVLRNEPQASAVQVVTLSHTKKEWIATLELQINVQAGLVGLLDLEVPGEWAGPFSIDPIEPVEVQRSAGGSARIVIRPQQAIARDYRIVIRGPLAIEAGSQVAVPDIRLRNVATLDRFAVLPQQIDGAAVQWEVGGMQPAELPDPFVSPLPDNVPVSGKVFVVVADGFEAVLKSRQQLQASSTIRMADIYVGILADGRHFGVAQFDVEPAAEDDLFVQLPTDQYQNAQYQNAQYQNAQYQIVQCRISDNVLPIERAGEGKWKLPLVSGRLPQRIEILFVANQ